MKETNYFVESSNKIKPIIKLYDHIHNVQYPVFLESDLITQNPIFIAGMIILCSHTMTLDNTLNVKIGDGKKSYTELPYVDKSFIGSLLNNPHFLSESTDECNMENNNPKIHIDFDIADLVILRSACKSAILQEQSIFENATSDDVKETAQKEIETLYGLVNKIKSALNNHYGNKIRKEL